ncbi:MAG TPA: MFS transporter [Blastocatellia bacterium]|nr:MFS transporter [Blastocatellia bacterium]
MNQSVLDEVNQSLAAKSPGRPSLTATYFSVFVAMGLLLCALGPMLPGLAQRTGTQLKDVSWLFMVRSVGHIIGSYVAGRIYDHRAGHPIMALAALITTSAILLLPIAPSLALMLVLILIQGIAGGTLNVGANTLLVWSHDGKPGGYLNGLHFSFGLGALLSPLVVERAITYSGDVKWAYWVLTFAFVPLALWLFRLPSPAPHKDPSHETNERFPYLLVIVTAIFFMLYTGAEVSLGSWLFNYVIALRLDDPQGAAYLNSSFWLFFTLGRLISIPAIKSFRPRNILYCDMVGCLTSIAVVLIWPKSLMALWFGMCGVGLSMGSVFPTMFLLAARRVPLTGKITGIFFAGSSVGSMTVPLLVGNYFESVGPQILPIVVTIGLSLAVLMLTVILIQHSRPVRTVTDPPIETDCL